MSKLTSICPSCTHKARECCPLSAAVGLHGRRKVGCTCGPGTLVLLVNMLCNILPCHGDGAGGMLCLPIGAVTAVRCNAKEVGCTYSGSHWVAPAASSCSLMALLTAASVAAACAVVVSLERAIFLSTDKIALSCSFAVAIAAFFS